MCHEASEQSTLFAEKPQLTVSFLQPKSILKESTYKACDDATVSTSGSYSTKSSRSKKLSLDDQVAAATGWTSKPSKRKTKGDFDSLLASFPSDM